MRTCQCTLPYTNPKACETCPNNKEVGEYDSVNIPTWPQKQEWPQDWGYQEHKKPYKRTVTEFDKDGKVTKLIVEEYDQIPILPLWSTQTISTGDTTSTVTGGDTHAS
jgi:hypothetical protein